MNVLDQVENLLGKGGIGHWPGCGLIGHCGMDGGVDVDSAVVGSPVLTLGGSRPWVEYTKRGCGELGSNFR